MLLVKERLFVTTIPKNQSQKIKQNTMDSSMSRLHKECYSISSSLWNKNQFTQGLTILFMFFPVVLHLWLLLCKKSIGISMKSTTPISLREVPALVREAIQSMKMHSCSTGPKSNAARSLLILEAPKGRFSEILMPCLVS